MFEKSINFGEMMIEINEQDYSKMKVKVYKVSEGCESDWVVAESEEQAIKLSKDWGCHCGNDERYSNPLSAELLSFEEIIALVINDDDNGNTNAYIELCKNQIVRFLCSSIY